MFKVTFAFENGSTVEAFANAGDNLLEVARGANVAIDAPCSGNGACGKCRVQLKSGELDSKKTLHISDEEYGAGWRLACMSKISADVEVLVPDIASAYKVKADGWKFASHTWGHIRIGDASLESIQV